jgi:hypothetical protein
MFAEGDVCKSRAPKHSVSLAPTAADVSHQHADAVVSCPVSCTHGSCSHVACSQGFVSAGAPTTAATHANQIPTGVAGNMPLATCEPGTCEPTQTQVMSMHSRTAYPMPGCP